MKQAPSPSAALEAPRRAATAQLPHEQAEIEGARVDQESFEDVAMSPQVGTAHPAGVVDVRERPLHVLPAATQQPLAARRPDAPAIAEDGPLRSGACVHCLRPRFGSETYDRMPMARRSSIV